MTKRIKEDYFKGSGFDQFYLLGAFYGGAIPFGKRGIIFRSSNQDLVEIVKRELESEHAIASDNREGKSSHWLRVGSTGSLREYLDDHKVLVPKKERSFPKGISKKVARNLVRGFSDTKGRIQVNDNGSNHLVFCFNPEFLLGLHQVLVRYAQVGEDNEVGSRGLVYSHADAIKAHDFMYQRFSSVYDSGLYLSEKKELFNLDHTVVEELKGIEEKMALVPELLRQGKRGAEIADELSYSSRNTLYKNFSAVFVEDKTSPQPSAP